MLGGEAELHINGISIDWDKISRESFLRAESFYNVTTAEDEYSKYGSRPQHFHEKSHGESFLAMAQNNFKGNGIYLLDELEAEDAPMICHNLS